MDRILLSLLLAATAKADLDWHFLKGSTSEKDTCPAVRLDQKGGPLEGVPVHDQGAGRDDTGLCYAAAGATLVDAHLRISGQGRDFNISPLSLAAYYKVEWYVPEREKGSFDFGNAGSAIKAAEGKPLCDYAFLNKISKGKYAQFIKQLTEEVAHFQRAARAAPLKSGVTPSCPNKSMAFSDISEILKSMYEASEANDLSKSLMLELVTICHDNSRVIEVPPTVFSHNSNYYENAREQIQQNLNAGVPVAINLNPEILNGFVSSKSRAGHYTAIAGQRYSKKAKSCQILVRDSYGIKCEKTTWDCSGGSYWINLDVLVSAGSQLVWLDEGRPGQPKAGIPRQLDIY